jgi:cardiolipin synthase
MILDLVLPAILVANLGFAVIIVFVERKTPATALAWLAALAFLPVLGFLLYIAFGRNYYHERLFRLNGRWEEYLKGMVDEQIAQIGGLTATVKDENIDRFLRVARMLLVSDSAFVTQSNRIEIYTAGEEKFRALFEAIRAATTFVHVEYFYINADGIGQELAALLTEKARQGVEVKVLVDGLPATTVPCTLWQPLRDAGGRAVRFFPGFLGFVNLRFNNRDHRKIVVVDGRVGFCGGFNVGDEYLGKKHLGFWRDTHVRVEGPAVAGLEMRFLLDWNCAARDSVGYDERFFPEVEGTGTALIQVVSSGPDQEHNQVKEAYLKLINTARDYVYIQTPYFVPDQSISDALRLAVMSGVDVRIMIPDKPDHLLVYSINRSFVREMLEAGVKVYEYTNGFIHAKTIVIDGIAASVGSANWDIRSFKLNFETNVLIYDQGYAEELARIFEDDLTQSAEITVAGLDGRPLHDRLFEPIARLFSSVL